MTRRHIRDYDRTRSTGTGPLKVLSSRRQNRPSNNVPYGVMVRYSLIDRARNQWENGICSWDDRFLGRETVTASSNNDQHIDLGQSEDLIVFYEHTPSKPVELFNLWPPKRVEKSQMVLSFDGFALQQTIPNLDHTDIQFDTPAVNLNNTWQDADSFAPDCPGLCIHLDLAFEDPGGEIFLTWGFVIDSNDNLDFVETFSADIERVVCTCQSDYTPWQTGSTFVIRCFQGSGRDITLSTLTHMKVFCES